MKRKRRSRRERIEEMAFIRATTRFLRLDQYLNNITVIVIVFTLNIDYISRGDRS